MQNISSHIPSLTLETWSWLMSKHVRNKLKLIYHACVWNQWAVVGWMIFCCPLPPLNPSISLPAFPLIISLSLIFSQPKSYSEQGSDMRTVLCWFVHYNLWFALECSFISYALHQLLQIVTVENRYCGYLCTRKKLSHNQTFVTRWYALTVSAQKFQAPNSHNIPHLS